jgi:integrase
MGRSLNRLTAVKVNKLNKPGMISDGGGLYLRISNTGAKSWIFRFGDNGRLRDMGLGGLDAISLKVARERAAECRELRAKGIDPISHQRTSKAAQRAEDAKSITFREAAALYIEGHEAAWGQKHHEAWTSTLRDHCGVLADLPVRMIETAHVMQVLSPIWKERTVTASRLRGRIEAVLDWSKVSGFREGENPARWRGHLKHLLPTPGELGDVEHYPALPYAEIGTFMAKLRKNTSMAARCLEFMALTAARLGEARFATWQEIDFESRTWTIPGPRMKSGQAHRVPLSRRAVDLLKEAWSIRRGGLVFWGRRDGALAATNILHLAKQVAGAPITVHGFRSSFRDWAAETTNYPREVAEMALAHSVGDAVERAYARTDLFERRRKLMDAWAQYCGKIETDAGKVVALAQRQKEFEAPRG